MNVALWIAAIVLALAFLAAGAMKLFRSKEQLVAAGQGWAEDFRQGVIRLIGLAELLGAIGLIVPAITGIAPALVGWAAVGLAVIMLGAIITHVRRKETPMIVPTIVLLALAVFVAWGRLGSYPLG